MNTNLRPRACPICHSARYEQLLNIADHYTGEIYLLGKCCVCGLKYIPLAPTINEIAKYYENSAGSNMRKAPPPFFKYLRDYAFRVEYSGMLKILGNQHTLLELGTGDGALAAYFCERGKKVIASDYYPLSDWHGRADIVYMQVDINHIRPEQISGIQAVVMRHVLEHVHEPLKLLETFADRQVRYLHILVPNVNSIFAGLFKENWAYWDPPRHLQFFDGDTLDSLAQRAGYRRLAVNDHGIDEIIVSLFRKFMLSWHCRDNVLRRDANPENTWWFSLLQPKGALCAVSGALSGFLLKTVLSRLYCLKM